MIFSVKELIKQKKQKQLQTFPDFIQLKVCIPASSTKPELKKFPLKYDEIHEENVLSLLADGQITKIGK